MKAIKPILVLLFLYSNLYLAAQAKNSTTEERTLHSAVLNEDRKVLIGLPEGYSAEKRYPVCYVLDGEMNFEAHQVVATYLAKKQVIPELIVVGIVNSNRSLDLTHALDTVSNGLPSGGGGKMEAFLVGELVPFIDSNYATASFLMLSGHSLGGLFATKILFNSPSAFNAYLIMDPAVWWKNMEVFQNERQRGQAESKVYLGMANSLSTTIKTVDEALQDSSNATLGLRSVFRLKELFEGTQDDNFNWKAHYYEDESHGTVPFKCAYDGFKFTFNYFKRPSFAALTDDSPTILDNHYKMISEKLGYQILPSAYDLSGLAGRCQELDKNHDLAFKFLQLFVKYYPEDPVVYMQLGQHYQLTGNEEKAQEYFQIGIDKGYYQESNTD